MATYPIKMLKDEQGKPFVPLTQVSAVIGEEYTISTLKASKKINGHYQIKNDKIALKDIDKKIISVSFPQIEEESLTSYLQLNDEEEYPIYNYEGSKPIMSNSLSNITTFLMLENSKYKMIKVAVSDLKSVEGHTIINNEGILLPQRPTLTFKGLSVNDDTATGSTIVNGPILINNLNTTENNKGALDAYQGKVLKDSIPEVINNLTDTNKDAALSANQGKILNEEIQSLVEKIKNHSKRIAVGELVIWEGDKLFTSNGDWQPLGIYYALKETLLDRFPILPGYKRRYTICLDSTDNIAYPDMSIFIKLSWDGKKYHEFMFGNTWGAVDDGIRRTKELPLDESWLPAGHVEFHTTPNFSLGAGQKWRIYKLYIRVFDELI